MSTHSPHSNLKSFITQSTHSKNNNDQAILDYLNRRGFTKAEQALKHELQSIQLSSSQPLPKSKTVGLDEFADKNVHLNSTTDQLHHHHHHHQKKKDGLGKNLIKHPSEYAKGYEGLREFINHSLDIHRPAFMPFLLPLFVHSYLELVLDGRRDAADEFLHRFSPDHVASQPTLIQQLASLRHSYHLQESELAQRWRSERYVIRISERAKNLLMAWLQTESIGGDTDESRAKDRMTSMINERVRVEYTNASILSQFQSGLESDLSHSTEQQTHPTSSNDTSKEPPPLKLGPAPKDPKLMREVERIISMEDHQKSNPVEHPDPNQTKDISHGDVTMIDGTKPPGPETPNTTTNPTAATTTVTSMNPVTASTIVENDEIQKRVIEPTKHDLLPYPNHFRTLDLKREVELVREARKRIRLGPEAFTSEGQLNQPKKTETEVWKPSVCAFTIHDAGQTMTATQFSDDVTILGAGFSDSSIKLWNLKGEPFEPIRDDGTLDSTSLDESESVRRMRKKTTTNSIKLIGHSGPVYSLSFDPIPGPSAPPRHLISSSQDSTIRLWSLDLFKNLVAYRGHREPVWDVEWGPKGIYFASASRDRTARLWCCERVNAVRMFVGHLSDVDCVTFHPNSLYMATGSSDRTCRLWDVQRGNCVRVFHGHEGAVNCVKISPDGRLLASAGEDQSIKIWDIGSSRLMKTMRGHQSSIHSLDFNAESNLLASGSSDESVRIWDVESVSNQPSTITKRSQVGMNGSLGFGSEELGLKGESNSTIKLLKNGLFGLQEYQNTPDLLTTLATRKTPILSTKFTTRNLLLAVGPMIV
ncbi:WD40-repeat-containing domain protein [Melampsora americana]|nr:WD40-repeat-containing domain protein [Melampsora americana]